MSNDMNHVFLIGGLTRDIGAGERSFAYVGNGQTARANVSIAVNHSVKKGDQWEDEVSYFDITIWGKTAENLKPYLLKGKQIAVDGALKQDRWQKDGQNFSKVYIVANTVQLLGTYLFHFEVFKHFFEAFRLSFCVEYFLEYFFAYFLDWLSEH